MGSNIEVAKRTKAESPQRSKSAGKRPISLTLDSWNPVERILRDGIVRSLSLLNLSSKGDVERLTSQVRALEQQLHEAQRAQKKTLSGHQRDYAIKSAELELLNEELRRIRPMAMLSAMVPSIAHDLISPISNSKLVATTLNDHLAEFRQQIEGGTLRRSDFNAFVDKVGAGLELIVAAGGRAATLSDSLKHLAIDFASERKREFSLATVINDALATLHPSLRTTPITVKTSIPDGIKLNSYPGPLSQVLINLTQNAVVHAFDNHEAGVISISARKLGRDRVRLRVTDNGAGMSQDVREKIFTPFFTTKVNSGGSGVGLSYAKQLVNDLLGGTITVQSTPGKGSEFTLDLPFVNRRLYKASRLAAQ